MKDRELIAEMSMKDRIYPAQRAGEVAAILAEARALAARPSAPAQPLPAGWRVQKNSDGSFGIFAPMPKPGESQRTSHAVYKSDRGDLADIVRRLCEHALATPSPAETSAAAPNATTQDSSAAEVGTTRPFPVVVAPAPVGGEAVAVVVRNAAGQISMQTPDGQPFDMSRHVGSALYTTPVGEAAEGWRPIETAPKTGEAIFVHEAGDVFEASWLEIPFKEYRDEDGFYTGQQDADAYWMKHEDGSACDPTEWQPKHIPAAPPVLAAAPQQGGVR